MTPRPPLMQIYLNSVSYGALRVSLTLARPVMESRPGNALGLLARIGVWLRIIFRDVFGRPVVMCLDTSTPAAPLNRTRRRRKRRSLPMARRADKLADVIRRHFGWACYLQWIYNRMLTSRVRWCFTAWNWAWRPRSAFLYFGRDITAPLFCGAALHPD